MSAEIQTEIKSRQPGYEQYKLSEDSEKAFMDALASDIKSKAPHEKVITDQVINPPVEKEEAQGALEQVIAEKRDESVPPSIKSSKAAEDWKKLKSELETKREEAKKLHDELEKIKNQPRENPEFESLKKEYEEMSEQIRILNIEQHPKFKKHFAEKIGQVQTDLKTVLGEEKAIKAFQILNLEESEYKRELLRDLVADMDEFQKQDLLHANRSLRTINHEKQMEIQKARGDWDNIRQRELQEEEKKKKSYLDIFSNVLSQAKATPFYGEKEGDQEWNKTVEQRVKYAQDLYSGNVSPDELAKAALLSAAAPLIMEHGKALTEENARLKKELEELRAAGPTVDGGVESDLPEDSRSSGDYRKDAESRASKIRFG